MKGGVRDGDGWVRNPSEQVCPTPQQGWGFSKSAIIVGVVLR